MEEASLLSVGREEQEGSTTCSSLGVTQRDLLPFFYSFFHPPSIHVLCAYCSLGPAAAKHMLFR